MLQIRWDGGISDQGTPDPGLCGCLGMDGASLWTDLRYSEGGVRAQRIPQPAPNGSSDSLTYTYTGGGRIVQRGGASTPSRKGPGSIPYP